MGSNTKTTKMRRKRKDAKSGRKQKKLRTKAGTPKFPIDPKKA